MESDSPGSRSITIVARLILVVAAGLLSVFLVVGFAVYSSAQQASAGELMATRSSGLSSQWNADMMHDALRADVMSAMYATTEAQRETYAVADVADNGKTMLSNFDAAAERAPDSLRAYYARVRPQVVEYAETAARVVEAAGADRAEAVAELDGYLKVYLQLEEEMGALDEGMLDAVQAASVQGADSGRQSNRVITLAGLAGALIIAVAGWQTLHAIRRPLRTMLAGLRALADCDLTTRVPVLHRDELGTMAHSLNEAIDSIRGTVAATAVSVGSLTHASGDLQQLSGDLDTSAVQTSSHAQSADASIRHVSAAVGAMMEATDELSSSIREIARQTASASLTTHEANENAARTAAAVERLSDASREVGDIVQLITNIAEQTNLLALNATIEAARAGAAGKGFAVVATEVKELAQETAQATADITAKISAIQEMTGGTAAAIASITDVIAQIDEGQRTIAAAVEEQSATTDLLSRNVGDVSAAAGEISGTVANITRSTEATATGANTTRGSAEEVSTAAGELRSLIGRFRY